MLHTWMYVSRSNPAGDPDPGLLDGIIRQSHARNAALDVTGGLLFTGSHFVQCVEGPLDNVRSLQASIRVDRRHHDVRDLRDEAASERCFSRWALFVVDNRSIFIEALIRRAITSAETRHNASIDALARFIIGYAKDG